jgi:two-component system, NtrC family, response regulator GlrR
MKDRLTPLPTSLSFGITPPAPRNRRNTTAATPKAVHQPKILVVDADLTVRRSMSVRLGGAHYAVQVAGTAQAALDECIRNRPNLVITDLRPPDMGGIAFLKELKGRWPLVTVIVLTAHGTIPEAVKATQCGAFSYLIKPIEREELLGQVQRAIATSTFDANAGEWRAKIVSRSQLMEDRLSIANRAASCELPILLTGENGTGKELLARAIHSASSRRTQAFVVLSCKNQPREQLEIELLGNESAESAFKRAQEGTLLLDEVGELPSDLQVTLSRILAAEMKKPPAEQARRSARIICTSSRDLHALAKCDKFHADLLEQISILPIEIPPLGRRREDIPLLVSHFLEQATDGTSQKKIYSPKAIELLATSDWPGNVRQLFELVKQHVALSRGKLLSKEFVAQTLGPQPSGMPAYDEARQQFSRDFLAAKLRHTRGNISVAARLIKRSRTDFYKLLGRFQLDPQDFKQSATREVVVAAKD